MLAYQQPSQPSLQQHSDAAGGTGAAGGAGEERSTVNYMSTPPSTQQGHHAYPLGRAPPPSGSTSRQSNRVSAERDWSETNTPNAYAHMPTQLYHNTLKWGFRNPGGGLASPTPAGLASPGHPMGVTEFNNPDKQGPIYSQASVGNPMTSSLTPRRDQFDQGGHTSPFNPSALGQSGFSNFAGYTETMPKELYGQPTQGGQKTQDLGAVSKSIVPSGTGTEGMSMPFTSAPVTYKCGENVVLHQWEETGALLVNCNSVAPQMFVCQYGISKGKMSWSFDISRTCDRFWFGVTTNEELDCNTNAAYDADNAFMISEEAEVVDTVYDKYVPRSVDEAPARPTLVQNGGRLSWKKVKTLKAARKLSNIWATVHFDLDADRGELWATFVDGSDAATDHLLIFRGLPRGFKTYPCMSFCNAGQAVFNKF